jgi:hypothetical protein
MDDIALVVLMYAVIPLWIAAGTADWLCHRATRIQDTAGLPENLMHWLMFAQVGAGLIAMAFLEINGLVLAGMLAVFVLHEATVYVELRYVAGRRELRPAEQMVHSFMELLPLVTLALLCVLAAGTLDLWWRGHGLDMAARAKREPWPPAYLMALGVSVLLFNVLPLAEETLRCLRARRR